MLDKYFQIVAVFDYVINFLKMFSNCDKNLVSILIHFNC